MEIMDISRPIDSNAYMEESSAIFVVYEMCDIDSIASTRGAMSATMPFAHRPRGGLPRGQ